MLKPVTDKHNEALALENKEIDEKEVWDWFEREGIGKQINGNADGTLKASDGFIDVEGCSVPFDQPDD